MARRMERLLEPRWTKPSWVEPGHSFRVKLEGPPAPVRLQLEKDGRTIPLKILHSSPAARLQADAQHPALSLELELPDNSPSGLYDLVAHGGERRACSFNSVCVQREPLRDFTFMHITDLHFAAGENTAPDPDYAEALKKLVCFVNAQVPAFVCFTGDLVSRYDAGKAPLPAKSIWDAAAGLQDILGALRVPAVVTAGNHDVAFPESRKAWAAYMGRPPERETDDFSFELGQAHFSILEAFVHYDPASHRRSGKGFTQAQLHWLLGDLQSTGAALRFVITHYDYAGQLVDILRRFGVSMLLYGHSNPMQNLPRGTVNGRLSDKECRFVDIHGAAFQCRTVDWWTQVGYCPLAFG
jgi:hypothetical protein